VPFKSALPVTDRDEARLFRVLASAPTPEKVRGGIEADEWDEELSCLASTIERTAYHQRRFKWIVNEAHARSDAFGRRVIVDQIAKFIGFEAVACLGAARTFVDQVYYVAQRRAGIPSIDKDKETAKAIEQPKHRFHLLPEVVLLREGYLPWFKELNAYRNAALHVGSRESMGVHRPGAMSKFATKADTNVLLAPDRSSLGKRPHEWSYKSGERLENVIARAADGLLRFALAVGRRWGGDLPAKGKRDVHDAVIVRPIEQGGAP
jgi:hypothetical protein